MFLLILMLLCQRYEQFWSTSGHDPRCINDGSNRRNISIISESTIITEVPRNNSSTFTNIISQPTLMEVPMILQYQPEPSVNELNFQTDSSNSAINSSSNRNKGSVATSKIKC